MRMGVAGHDGMDDIPLNVQDFKFTPEGARDESDSDDTGLFGKTAAAGMTGAYFEAGTWGLRLRVLNASVGPSTTWASAMTARSR